MEHGEETKAAILVGTLLLNLALLLLEFENYLARNVVSSSFLEEAIEMTPLHNVNVARVITEQM